MSPAEMLRHHVTGAVQRGEAQPVHEIPAADNRAEVRFNAWRARWKASYDALESFRRILQAKYGDEKHANRTERAKLDRLRERASKDSGKLIDYVCANSPRDWRAGVPCHWINSELRWEDVVTRGELSTVPPPAYGYTDRDMKRFAAAL